MTTCEGEEVGSLSNIDVMGDEYGFTVYGADGEELLALAFHTEADARTAHKMMQDVFARAVAIVPAIGP